MTVEPTTNHMSQLASWAKDGRLAVLTGAGVSMLAPSSLPSWWRLNVDLYWAFTKADVKLEEFVRIIESLPLPPSVLAQFLWEILGNDEYAQSLALLRGGSPNRNHHVLAAMVGAGHLTDIFTLNFDQLHERALTEAGIAYQVQVDSFELANAKTDRSARVSKLHGSIDLPRSILATLDQTSKENGIGPVRKAALREARERANILVLGYSGGDFFLDPDYLGFLSHPCPTKLIWNMRPGEVADSDHPLVRLSAQRPEIVICEGLLPEVLERLAEACGVNVSIADTSESPAKAPVPPWLPPDGAWAGHLYSKVFAHIGAKEKELACYRWEARQAFTYPGLHRAAWAIEGLAVWYLAHGHRELAKSFLTSLYKLLEITGDSHAKQRVRQALGQLYKRYPPRSEERQAQGRNLVALAVETNDASVLNDLGLMQYEEEAHTTAIATFERALALLDGGSTALRATVYGNLALAQAKIGVTESAIRNFSNALRIEDAIGNREGAIYQLRNLGQLYLQRKEPELAIPLLKRAADLGEGVASAYTRAEISGMLGDALVTTHREAEARTAYEQAARAASESTIHAASYLYDFIKDKLARLQDPIGKTDTT